MRMAGVCGRAGCRTAQQFARQFVHPADLRLKGDVARAIAVEKAIEQHHRSAAVIETGVARGRRYNAEPSQPLGVAPAVLSARVTEMPSLRAGKLFDHLAVPADLH